MHQNVCGNHFEQEIRLRTLERDVGEMKGEIKEIKRDVASISRDMKNLKQSNDGLVDMMQNVLKNNFDVMKIIKENKTEVHKNYLWIIRIMVIALVMIALGRILDVGSMAV